MEEGRVEAWAAAEVVVEGKAAVMTVEGPRAGWAVEGGRVEGGIGGVRDGGCARARSAIRCL